MESQVHAGGEMKWRICKNWTKVSVFLNPDKINKQMIYTCRKPAVTEYHVLLQRSPGWPALPPQLMKAATRPSRSPLFPLILTPITPPRPADRSPLNELRPLKYFNCAFITISGRCTKGLTYTPLRNKSSVFKTLKQVEWKTPRWRTSRWHHGISLSPELLYWCSWGLQDLNKKGDYISHFESDISDIMLLNSLNI